MPDIAAQKSFQQRLNIIRTLEKKELVSPEEETGLTLQDAGVSSFFEYAGQTYYIQELNRYEETSENFKTSQNYFIYELTCLCLETGKTVYFEWEFDDELEISMTLERFSFRDLFDEEGESIDDEDLDQIVDDKDLVMLDTKKTGGNSREKFWYEDDWAAVFHRDNKKENVYLYEFENEAHSCFLTIEEWSGSGRDAYRIYTSAPVQPGSIRLISKGDVKG